MSDNNPYAAPQSNLESHASTLTEPSYYVVSQKKFMVLFISTVGIYILFWFWKNWSFIKNHEGSSIWPIPRAIFSIFFIHKLFNKIGETAESHNHNLPALNNYATIFVVVALVNYFSGLVVTSAIVTTLFLVVSLGVQVWCIWQAQLQANTICDDVEGLSNDSFSGGNIALIVFGVFLWLSTLAPMFMLSSMV